MSCYRTLAAGLTLWGTTSSHDRALLIFEHALRVIAADLLGPWPEASALAQCSLERL